MIPSLVYASLLLASQVCTTVVYSLPASLPGVYYGA